MTRLVCLAQARLAETDPDSRSSSRSRGELSFERDTISLRLERRSSGEEAFLMGEGHAHPGE